MLDLAVHIVGTKKGKFEPEKFEDQYEDALQRAHSQKAEGRKDRAASGARPIECRESHGCLRQSVKSAGASERSKPARASAKKGKKRIEGQREMLLPISGKKGKEAADKRVVRRAARHKKAG